VNIDQAKSLTAGPRGGGTFFKRWMPYLYQRVEVKGRKHVFLPLNRNYRPLGTQEFADYAAVADTYGVAFRQDPGAFENIWWNTDDAGRFWLYDDSAKSRVSYFERLERLMLKSHALLLDAR